MKKLIVSLILLITTLPCYGTDFCETVEVIQENYCLKNITPAKIDRLIYVNELSDIIEDATGLLFSKKPIDRVYKLTTIEEIKRFLEYDDTDKLLYVIDWRDCDDFAKILMVRVSLWTIGLAFGYISIDNGSHVINIFVDSNLQVWGIDAQKDVVYEIDFINSENIVF